MTNDCVPNGALYFTTTVAEDAGRPDRLIGAVLRRLSQVDEPLVLADATVTATYNPSYMRDEVTITAPYAKRPEDREVSATEETTLVGVVSAIKAMHKDMLRIAGAKYEEIR